MSISPELRTEIIVAAAAATPAVEYVTKVVDGEEARVEDSTPYNVRVANRAVSIYQLATSDHSPAVRALDGIANAKVFTAVVRSVTKEKSSTRGLVTLYTGTDRSDDGTEQARTERTDDPMGLAMARALRAVIGHKILVFIEVEPIGDGSRKVRVIRHFEDLGPAPEGEA